MGEQAVKADVADKKGFGDHLRDDLPAILMAFVIVSITAGFLFFCWQLSSSLKHDTSKTGSQIMVSAQCDKTGTTCQIQLSKDQLETLTGSSSAKIELLEKRIDDIGTIGQLLGISTGVFGILVTAIVIYFSFNQNEKIQAEIERMKAATAETKSYLADQKYRGGTEKSNAAPGKVGEVRATEDVNRIN